MAKVILHADDFGFNNDCTDATINLFEKGVLTSASIMVNCEASDLAIKYASNHPEYSFGIHLTFVDGLHPITDCRSVLDIDGNFLESPIVRKKGLTYKLRTSELISEINGQIQKAKDDGVKISHLDSHGHLHKFPQFLKALSKLQKQSGQLKVRRVQNMWMLKHGVSATALLNSLFDKYISHKFKTTDYFYMPANNFDVGWADNILSKVNILPKDSIVEIGIHPGKSEQWRENEYNDVIDFFNKLSLSGKHQIINWNDI